MAFPSPAGSFFGYADALDFAHKLDVADMIALLNPNENPFTSILLQIGNKKPAVNPKFDLLYDVLNPEWFTVNVTTTYTNTNTLIIVDDATGLRIGDILEIYTPTSVSPATEHVQITAIAANNTGITITRSFHFTTGSTATTIPDESVLHVVGQTIGDKAILSDLAGGSGIVRTIPPLQVTNYCQLFEDVVSLSKVEMNTEHYGTPDYRNHLRNKAMQSLKRRIENAFIWGVAKKDTAGTSGILNGQTFSTGGFWYWLNQTGSNYSYPSQPGYILNVAGQLTQSSFQGFLRAAFRYGSGEKWFFVSPLLAQAIDSWNLTAVRVGADSQLFGVNTKQYVSSFGKVNIVQHKMLEVFDSRMRGLTAGPLRIASSGYNDYTAPSNGSFGFLVDMEDVRVRYLQNMDLTMLTDVGVKGDQPVYDAIYGMLGLELRTPAKHAAIYGFTSYGA